MKNNYFNLKSLVQVQARWLITIIAVLTVGIGEMWGGSEGSNWCDASGANVYFDNTNSSYTYVSMLIGRDYAYNDLGDDGNKGSWGINFSLVSGTNNLYYASVSVSKYRTFCFIDATNWGWEKNNTVTDRYGYASNHTTTPNDDLSSRTHLYVPASSSSDASVTHTTPASYTALNYTQTLNQTLSTDGGSTFSASTAAIATVKVESKKLNGNSSTTDDSGTISSGYSSTSCAAARTATVTYSVSSVATGYEFVGWYDGSTQKSTSTSYTYNATEAKTITARFKETQYSLTFSHNGHGSISVGGSAVASGSTANVNHFTTKDLEASPNTGYNFSSWALSGTNTSAVTIGSTSTASTTIKATNTGATVTANFAAKTYSITLDDDGEYQGNGSATVQYGDGALTVSSHASRDGWNLLGYWNTSAVQVTDAEGNLRTSVSGYTDGSGNWIYDGNVTLYAHWSQTYTVSYNAGGGSGSMSSNTGISSGGSQTISANSFTRSGYTFSHWTANVAVTANSSAVSAGGTIAAGATLSNITSNIALTAQWTENDYTVTVSAGSHGSVASTSVTGHMDTKVSLPTATASTGYHFDTWTTTTGSVTYDNQTSATTAKVYGLSAAATVQATFAANTYSVVFNENGGTGTMSNESFTYDADAKALTTNTFTYSGYTFVGWATSTERAAALTVDYTDGQSVQNLTSENGGTFNLYAVWAKKYYIGGRFQHDWEEGDATTNEMTYDATTGYYKFETSKTVNELSVQWENTGDYSADQYFYIHTGKGKGATSALPTYVGASSNGHTMQVKIGYSNAYVLTAKTSSFDSFGDADLLKFSNTDNLSSDVIVWWDPANKKIWYTATESLNTNYYLLGFGTSNWSETSTRRFTVDEVNATTATVSVELTAKTYTYNTDDGFKVENGGTYYGNNGTMTRASCSSWTFETDKNNCGITADVAGTYTFTLNLSTKAVSVTYPTSYTVTFAASPSAAADAPTNDLSVSSGDYVVSGSSITFTKDATPNSGYTWKGWYDNSAGTGDALGTGSTYTTTISANTTVYACYTEDMHDVTINAETGGTVRYNGGDAGSSCTARAGVATASANIEATASTGYYFVGWQLPDGTITKASESAYNGSTSTYTINATADSKTVTALFNVRYALLGSQDDGEDTPSGMPGWGEANEAPFTYSAGTYTKSVSLTVPNTNYKFRIVDRLGASHTNYGLSSKAVISADGNYHDLASTSADAQLATAGVGSYTLTVQTNASGKPKVMITNPTSYLITYGKVVDNGQDKGSVSATGDNDYALSSGGYVANGSVTFTAAAESGYRFVDWRDNSTYGGGSQLSTANPYTMSSISANKTVYANYAENLCTVTITTADASKGTITVGGASFDWDGTTQVGVYNTKALVVTPAAGYYFSGWTLSDTPDFAVGNEGEAGASTTLSGLGGTHGSTGTLTANFTELEKVYFFNEDATSGDALWSGTIYAYFAFSWSTNQAVSNSNSSYIVEMTQISGTNIWWCYAPRSFTTSNNTNVAFSNHQFAVSTGFSGAYKAAGRGDYNKLLNMFVPKHTSSNTDNSITYYSNGYWRLYDTEVNEGAGYYLKLRTGSNTYTQQGEFVASATGGTTIQFTMRVDNTSNKQNYLITSAGGINYKASASITSSACTNISVVEDNNSDAYFNIATPSEGDYKFVLEQDSDVMKLSIIYPVGVGDYRLKHKYTISETAHYTYSDVIKAGTSSQTMSMYLNMTNADSLVLQKCTAVSSAGVATWSSGEEVSNFTTNFKNGDGVYKFGISISNDAGTASSIGLYTGNFYIKTDAGTGGWTNYTSNKMTLNTQTYSTSDDSTFNYYYCRFLSSGTNAKCVIANDYCNAVSDTLIQDATYLTTAGGGSSKEYMPADGSVRFSYNSKTNQIGRTFLSAGSVDNYLVLRGSGSTLYDAVSAGSVISTGGTADWAKFSDKGDYIYDLTVYTTLNNRVKLTASFNGTHQFLQGKDASGDFGTTNTIAAGCNGSEDANRYGIHLIYDFKTNNLKKGVILPETISSDITVDELVYSRNDDTLSTQISIGSSAVVTTINQMTMEMTISKAQVYDSWEGSDTDDGGKVLYFWISVPFRCKVSDIYGFGTCNVDWEIQRYRGDRRANGWPSNYVWSALTTLATMNPNEGYVLAIKLYASSFQNGYVRMYFPSVEGEKVYIRENDTIAIPSYLNASTGWYAQNWHIMGVPLLRDSAKVTQLNNAQAQAVTAKIHGADRDTTTNKYRAVNYVYRWSWADGNRWYEPIRLKEGNNYFNFRSGNGYMVQGSGYFVWSYENGGTGVSYNSPARAEKSRREMDYRLNLNYDGELQDKTYVTYTDEATVNYDMGYDLDKIMNDGRSMLYTDLTYKLAALALPYDDQQLIPLTIIAAESGEYTVHAKYTTGGIVPVLYDAEEGTTTRLTDEDFIINLAAGTYSDRFFLGVSRTQDTATDLNNYELQHYEGQAGSHPVKFIKDGVMYILIDGKIYDATGQRR